MPDIALPQAWIPDEQDNELAGITESDIERHIRSLKAQLPQEQGHLQQDIGRVAGDEQRIDLIRGIIRNLDMAGMDAPESLRTEAEDLARQEAERAAADLHDTVEESSLLRNLHEQIAYSEAWIAACNHLRSLPRSGFHQLTEAIDRLAATVGQLALPAHGSVILALPDGVQQFDVHIWQQKTVEMGKRISRESKELSVKLFAPANRAEEKSNVILRVAFKVGQFLYYAITLARAGSDVLMQVIHDLHGVLGKFLALLPATMRLSA